MMNIGIKDSSGQWKNYTVAVNDETNEWGKNVSVWEAQTQEEREAKKDKVFCGNGKVFWTDGNVQVAEKKPQPMEGIKEETNDLPF